jgi:hypothetical protein
VQKVFGAYTIARVEFVEAKWGLGSHRAKAISKIGEIFQ